MPKREVMCMCICLECVLIDDYFLSLFALKKNKLKLLNGRVDKVNYLINKNTCSRK